MGWLYTATHDITKYPSAILYGTWSGILGLHLLKDTSGWQEEKIQWAIDRLNQHRRKNGSFLPLGIENVPTSKSLEYLTLHCTNYCIGAALEIFPEFEFETNYMDRFLDGDYLEFWLEGRSLQRPWEEGNNIVNVASYLALCHKNSINGAADRLSQLLEWHKNHQNPKTGGFDSFEKPSSNQRLQALAGAVHNYHLYHYLGEKTGYETEVAVKLPYFLAGNLSACLSIDFVELAIHTLPYAENPQELIYSLILHLEVLLSTQRSDGGWLEADNERTKSATQGFQDTEVSSCSYATWFKLCSLGMIAIVLLNDSPRHWGFRKTLGMGYAPSTWPKLPAGATIDNPSHQFRLTLKSKLFPAKIKRKIIEVGSRLI